MVVVVDGSLTSCAYGLRRWVLFGRNFAEIYSTGMLLQASCRSIPADRSFRRAVRTTAGKVRTTSSKAETVGRGGMSAVVAGGSVRTLVGTIAALVARAEAMEAGGAVWTGVGA